MSITLLEPMMNFDEALSVEFRVVDDTLHDGQPARIVGGTRTYLTDIEDLWDALTNPARIPRWFSPIEGDLKLGGRYQLEGNAGGEITKCEPPESFEISWEFSGNVSWVSVRLTPDGKGTRLTLEHTMLKDKQSEDHWKKFGPGATGVGWELGFAGLGLHLTNGNANIDQKRFHSWMASETGKSFIKESAKAWGQAHIAMGESPDVAIEMATETTKAYTGEQ